MVINFYLKEKIFLEDEIRGQIERNGEVSDSFIENRLLEDRSQDQVQNAGFALRMRDSAQTMVDLIPKLREKDRLSLVVELLADKSDFLRAGFQSAADPDVQRFARAAKDFVNAQLRQESGGVYNDYPQERISTIGHQC